VKTDCKGLRHARRPVLCTVVVAETVLGVFARGCTVGQHRAGLERKKAASHVLGVLETQKMQGQGKEKRQKRKRKGKKGEERRFGLFHWAELGLGISFELDVRTEREDFGMAESWEILHREL